MPGLSTRGGSGSEWEEGSALRHRVAHRTLAGKYLSRLVHMMVIMAPEAPGPVAVPDIVGVSCPVDLHRRKDVTTVDGEDGVDCLRDFGSLTLENIRIILGVISFDEQTDLILNPIGILVIIDQCIQGKFLDPGKFV